ncbi:hypothetical protein I4F81_006397 [Pyropia yezoensis]|uniref:Uncharacterized protein n=1 Tax=Pyropia yezoensis TaxID=2788 RepID=A0ACC3C167_PYRYE|nr:hypothetical protein I4F81_006397 [Neopyropia yezoensis]
MAPAVVAGGGGREEARPTPPAPSAGSVAVGGAAAAGPRSLASLSESEPATYFTAAQEFGSSGSSGRVGTAGPPQGGAAGAALGAASGVGPLPSRSRGVPPPPPPPAPLSVVVETEALRAPSTTTATAAASADAADAAAAAAAAAAIAAAAAAATATDAGPPSRGWAAAGGSRWWTRRPPPSSAASTAAAGRSEDAEGGGRSTTAATSGGISGTGSGVYDGGGGSGGGGGSSAGGSAWAPVGDTPRSSFWTVAFGRPPPWASAGGSGGGTSSRGGWGSRAFGSSARGRGGLRAAAGATPSDSFALSGWEPQSDVHAYGLPPSVTLPPPGARAGVVDLGGVAAALAADDAGDDDEEDELLSVDDGSAGATPVAAAGRGAWGVGGGLHPHRSRADAARSSRGSGGGSGRASPPPSSVRVRKPGRAAAKPADLFSLEDDVQAEAAAAAAAAAEDAKNMRPRCDSVPSYETRDTSSLASEPRVKLEVLRASDIKGVHQVLFSSIALGGLYLLAVIVLCNTAFMEPTPLPNDEGVWEIVRVYSAPIGFQVFEVVSSGVLFCIPAIVFIVFALRIWRLPRAERTQEQVWVLMLYTTTLLYFNPVYEIATLLKGPVGSTPEEILESVGPWGTEWAFTSTVFVSYAYFYVWISVHSYRIMRGRLLLFFYAPKILVLTLFGALRVVIGVYGRIYLGYLPFTSIVGTLMLVKHGVSRQAYDFSLVILVTVFEAVLIGWLCYEVSLTRKALARTSYMRYRSKQIGFRFFLFHVASSFGSLFIFNVLLVVSFPSEPVRLIKERLSLHFLGAQPGKLASDIILLVFLAQESWVNLPADAYGLRGWFSPPTPEPGDVPVRLAEPHPPARRWWGGDSSRPRPIAVEDMFTYRQREPPTGRPVSPRCLVMDTTVLMFNMAWIAYSYGTPRKRRRQPADYGRDDHIIARYAVGRRTDTHALVVDAPDRIIVAFKGSTNLADLRTDISVFTVDIETVLALPLTAVPRGGGATPADGAVAGATADETGGDGGDGEGDQERATAARGAAGGLDDDAGALPRGGSALSTPAPPSANAPLSSPPTSSTGSRHLRAAMRKASLFSLASDKIAGRATVHTGFSSAYLSVRREVVESVMALYRDRPRPIWLTGHSLGGALATLCSYDLARRVAAPAAEISVVTFGAPRVGNAAFRAVYNDLIPRHWRVVLASDVVTKLPKLGYLHVGNQALLTNEAQLFIDPSFVELKWFHWKGTSIRTHRKGNYISAMQAWCRTEHGARYAPDFWLERGGKKGQGRDRIRVVHLHGGGRRGVADRAAAAQGALKAVQR